MRPDRRGALLAVCPHAKHVDGPAVTIDLIDQTVQDVDAAGVRASEVSDQLREAGRRLERIVRQQLEKLLRLGPETRMELVGADFVHSGLRCPPHGTNYPTEPGTAREK